jgi:hypothetical protein
MQPSKNQVEQSLAALSTTRDATAARVEEPSRSDEPVDPRLSVDHAIGALPEGLLEQIERTIDVRPDRLDKARARLEHVDELSADELADRIIGRLVCDRLR